MNISLIMRVGFLNLNSWLGMLGLDSLTLISLALVIMCTNYPSSKVRASFITFMNEPFFFLGIGVKNELEKMMEVLGRSKRLGKWNGFRFPWKDQRSQVICVKAKQVKTWLLGFTNGPKWCATLTMFVLFSKLISSWSVDIIIIAKC